ncbi:ferritin-like domain-containing protein [Derxia gummosa]|uniref:Ferritin-like domain-containing protein n=1 Tax=Derxia gummosa DSM 723 TaxID=1121388 RepID=A0A8B6X3K7_9BURK|nr:ferritin-like domain-containing protein [Derxia gummosa]
MPAFELRSAALVALSCPDPDRKCALVAELNAARKAGGAVDADAVIADPGGLPGRPARPELVHARDVASRGVGSVEGRAALLHALAHIEFNAINLALDAVWRFARMPEAFYDDWLLVAVEEALHFNLLRERLRAHGHDYGDFSAHNGLWDMAERTAVDPLARMALVPRTMEARGLDVTPGIRAKLMSAGDRESAGVLDVILRDEVGHVRIGNRWYDWLCERDGLSPANAHVELAQRYRVGLPRAPFNTEARLAAGFTPEQLDAFAGVRD